MTGRRRWFAALTLLFACAAPAPGRALTLPDSTQLESFRLANGLEVRTRHVPGARGISMTLGVRAGSGYDTPAREGLGELLAEVFFSSATGEIPERTREEMLSLRPLGWGLRVNARHALFTEIASREQFPGVLRQVATRLRGVTVTDKDIRESVEAVRRERGSRSFGDADRALYWRVSEIARGLTDEQIVRFAASKTLDGLSAKQILTHLQTVYVPANTSLAIAGDLSGFDVRALVEREFGPIASGVARPDTVASPFQAGRRAAVWKGLAAPIGVIAIQAPAITDTMHASFYLSMLVTGAGVSHQWGAPTAPLTSRFQYALFEEPELVRFYPSLPASAEKAETVQASLYETLDILAGTVVSAEILDRVRFSVDWLLGGPLPKSVRKSLASEPAGLGTMSANMVTRALWRGDAFWDDYERRFLTSSLGHSYFYEYAVAPEHQAVLLFTPK